MQQRAARICGRLPLVWLLLSVLVGSVFVATPVGCKTSKPKQEDAEQTGQLSQQARILQLASFDYVWETIRNRHFDPTFGGLDWDAMRAEYRPRVLEAKNQRQVRGILNEMIGRLELTHFQVIPSSTYDAIQNEGGDSVEEESLDANDAESSSDSEVKTAGSSQAEEAQVAASEPSDEDGVPGFDVRVMNGQALVTEVREDSKAWQLGVRPGWEIVSIRGRPMVESIQRIRNHYQDSNMNTEALHQHRAILHRFSGKVGETIPAQFRAEDDELKELAIPLVAHRGKLHTLGELGGHVWYESQRLDSGVGYIHFSMFLGGDLVSNFSKSITEFRDAGAPGIILDLRGNPGGIGLFAISMSGWFFEYSGNNNPNLELGTMHLRRTSLKFAVNPRLDSYRGRLAILMDGCSASTSEIMAGGLADLGRGRVFGTRSAGAALPSVIERLPNGDAFQYAVANYVSKSGVVLEGRGVIPDQEVQQSRRGLLAGHDEVLEAAEGWLLQESPSTGEKD